MESANLAFGNTTVDVLSGMAGTAVPERMGMTMTNEKRLIDVDAARRRIIAFATGLHSEVLSVDTVMMLLTHAPTVDAVEVVRCRDCKHMIMRSNMRYCAVWHGPNGMGDDGFCNYGERKEGDGNG